jgi:tellurite resistance protein TerC
MATPLLLVLLVIDVTDVVFAVDSIPAILAIVKDDTYIAYSSNAFAILGLRALYFALAAMVDVFRFLHYGLAATLIFIGGKMFVEEFWHVKMLPQASLGIVLGFLIGSILVSLVVGPKKEPAPESNSSEEEVSEPVDTA